MIKENVRVNVEDEKFSGKKAFGFALTRASSILSSLLIGQITYFGTNSLGLTAAAIASGMGLKAVIDAVTDLFMGVIVDKTNTKWGKARPYCLSGVLVWLCVLAIFFVPTGMFANMDSDSRNIALVIYITLFGTLASAVFETMRGVAFDTHLKRSIVKDDNRVKIMTIGGAVFSIGSLGLQIALPAVISAFHGSQKGFMILAGIFGVMGITASIACFFMCKEYTQEELNQYYGYKKDDVQEKISISSFLKSVVKNKYIFMWTILNFFLMMNLLGAFNSGQYYFQYVFGNLGAFSAVMAMSAIALPVVFFLPKLCRKYGVINIVKISVVFEVIGIIIRILIPKSLPVQCISYFLFQLPNIPSAFVGSQVTIECMEYGSYKSGVIAEAMYSSFISFAQKIATSISSFLLGVILTASGFDMLTKAVAEGGFTDWAELMGQGTGAIEQYVAGGVETVNHVMTGISIIYNYIPLALAVISFILLLFFNLEKDLKKLRAEHGVK